MILGIFLEWEIWWWDFWWFECWFGFLDVWVEWNYYRLSEQSNCNFKCKHTPSILPILCRFSPKHNIDRNILETVLLTFLNRFQSWFFSNISWSCYKLLFIFLYAESISVSVAVTYQIMTIGQFYCYWFANIC